MTSDLHVLRQLQLPDRYENLAQQLGDRVAELIVEPDPDSLREFRRASEAIKARKEGAFMPLYGLSGEGKTTLANSLSVFLPSVFAPTTPYSGPVDYDALNNSLAEARGKLKSNDDRITPLNFDHREGAPPDRKELATIKRFLRSPSLGASCVVIWPEVSEEIASDISKKFESIAGKPAFEIPVPARGPDRDSWQEIAGHTLQLVNQVPSIEEMGVSPTDYEPAEHNTLGAFLRQISNDFIRLRDDLLASTIKPINLVIIYASESHNAGVLSQLTSGAKYGLLDSQALLSATPSSMIGRWWSSRRGLLTQTILKLNARAFCLPPAPAIAILRAHGASETQENLRAEGVNRQHPYRISQYLSRTDVGKFLTSRAGAAYEARGRPAENAQKAFAALAESGLTKGRDKALNAAMATGFKDYCQRQKISVVGVEYESTLGFANLIPDVHIAKSDEVVCLEFAWRSGEFLDSGKRSEVARYALTKLKNYAINLGWAAD